MKKSLVFLFGLFAGVLHSQSPPPAGASSFGFFSSVEIQTLNLELLAQEPAGPYYQIHQRNGAGAGLGVWGQWPLLPVLQIRPGVQFSYLKNEVTFKSPDGQTTRTNYTFADIELPLHFVLRDRLRHLPLQGLIVFGGRLGWNLAATPEAAALRILPERLGLDIGIGAGFQWGKWDIQPEVIYSYGLTNTHDFQNGPFDWVVGRVLRDRLSLRVTVGLER